MTVALATRGVICGPMEVRIIVPDHPTVSAASVVAPAITATVPPEVPGAAGEPTMIAASELRPEIQSTVGPEIVSSQSEPEQISAEELRPQIRSAEEE